MKILSICIPTYNRLAELSELVDQLLELDRHDFEIVITDNVSTDGTPEKYQSHPDQRVRYCRNACALPPFMNMIHSIFNASGKYALYCNDRDLVHRDQLPALMDILACNEFAFVHGPARMRNSSGTLKVFEKGFDSLSNHSFIHHPTGMIYNRELIAQHLHEEDYEQYIACINTYDFLMLDLFQYGKSAKYYAGYWSSRPSEYISKHKSGTGMADVSKLYFSPEMRERMFYGIMGHVFLDNDYQMNLNQKAIVANKLYMNFAALFSKYKACMSDPHETAHYGLVPARIPTNQIVKVFNAFFDRSSQWMTEKGFDDLIIRGSKKRRLQYSKQVVVSCFKIDAYNLLRKIKR